MLNKICKIYMYLKFFNKSKRNFEIYLILRNLFNFRKNIKNFYKIIEMLA